MEIKLAQAVLINDSKREEIAGDVYLFRDKTTAASWLEPVDVENQEHFAYHLNGVRLRTFIDRGIVQFAEEPGPGAPDIVRSLLVQTARHVLRARVLKGKKTTGEPKEIDLGRLSLLELAELVGLSR
jgi:hypothetical protein